MSKSQQAFLNGAVSPEMLFVYANTLKVVGANGLEEDVEVGEIVEEDVVGASRFVVLGEPIVGKDVDTYNQQGQGALEATPWPSPREPTPQRWRVTT